MTANRHGSSVIEYPSELEIVTTREFDAPLALVFDVMTKPEHVSKWFAPFTDRVTECSIDLRVGGGYHVVFVTAGRNGVLVSGNLFGGRGAEPDRRNVAVRRLAGRGRRRDRRAARVGRGDDGDDAAWCSTTRPAAPT